jgi:SAM-dependent methyltransferase
MDIGCGKGVFLDDFCRALSSTYGLTPERLVGMDLVQSPGNEFGRLPACFTFLQGDVDGAALPFPDETFDIVTCNHVLEHVFETELLLDEIRRTLKPDGFAVVSVPNVAAWMNRLLFLFGIQPLGSELGTRSITYGFRPNAGKGRLGAFSPSGHIRDFTPFGLRDLLEACGFHVQGWWNQDGSALGPLCKRCSRNMGVIATPRNSGDKSA